jgi:hypothetical protein
MKTGLTLVLVVFACICLQSCSCDCFDDSDASVLIAFNTDSTHNKSFTLAELDSCIMVTKLNGIPIDTQRLPIYIDAPRLFPVFQIYNTGAMKKTSYINPNTYFVYNDSPRIELTIDQINIQGKREGGLWCTCYTNEYIKYRVNGVEQYHKGQQRSGAQYTVFKP